MPHQDSVFRGLLKRVPWGEFDRLVSEHNADRRVRSLSTKDLLIAQLFAQFSGASSLREIEAGLRSHRSLLYHLGGNGAPKRATLADANARRPVAVFAGLFARLAACAHRGLRRRLPDTTYLIDASGIRLAGRGSEWAVFSHQARGAKLHLVYDADADCPIHAEVSAANVNDITPAKTMPIEPGATYVFDLGYYSYDWWAELDAKGCRIVTRLKKTTKLRDTVDLDVPDDDRQAEQATILSDRIGFLPPRGKRHRHAFTDPVREVVIETDTGKTLRLMCNDLDASAREIADLYKRRWAIELFFKWIKQTLEIKRPLGRSENALAIQVLVALIAFLLLRLAHADQNAVETPRAFARLVALNIMHRRRIDRLLDTTTTATTQSSQMELSLCS